MSKFIQQPGRFNDELIQQCFLNPDTKIILSIPLSPFDHLDSWLWNYNRKGNYSIKSGYNLAISLVNSDPSSSSNEFATWWRSYWAIKIPQKILIFGWRGFHEILPTYKGLHHRNVSTNSNCPLCGYGKDSNAHAVVWCTFSQKLWNILDFNFLVGHKEEISFKNVLLYASEVLDKDLFAKMQVTMWGVWNERNNYTHGQQTRTPQLMKIWLSAFYEDIKNALDSEGSRQER